MSVLDKLASAQGRRDEVPNQELAREIAAAGDTAAVQELIDHLTDRDKEIQSDCIKVLYEIGALNPDLIAGYTDDFVKLLGSRNNRLVWGGMTALGAIAERSAPAIWRHIDGVMLATENGSAITQDWGIRVLAAVSAHDKTYERRIVPFLTQFLRDCPPKDLPRHAESALVAANHANARDFLAVLEARRGTLKAAQSRRVDQVIRKIKAL